MKTDVQKEIIPENYQLLIPEERIQERISQIGKEIAAQFTGKRPILIGVLNGGFMFLSDLIRNIDTDLEIDFMRISSYGDSRESTGHIKILKPLNADIRDRAVIVVEDIVDSGLSIQFLKNMLSAFQPSDLRFATLLHKPERTRVHIHLDYVGFEIKDQFVVGYGLDDAQAKRNLRSIYVVG